MKILDNLFGTEKEPDRPKKIGRNEAQRIRLNDFRHPWYNYWTEVGGDGYYVVGGPKRKATIFIPILFPTRAIARSIAKYMRKSARLRVNGTLVK